MAQKVYKRIGLRRDRNLNDLANSTEALNNMLGDLAAVGGARVPQEIVGLYVCHPPARPELSAPSPLFPGARG